MPAHPIGMLMGVLLQPLAGTAAQAVQARLRTMPPSQTTGSAAWQGPSAASMPRR